MSLSPSLTIALKEWATVVRALESGRQIMLLRKGGILEQSVKNRFSITHNEFLFFPTYLHQSRGELKAEVEFEPIDAEPSRVRITSAGVVTDIIRIESRGQLDRLDDQHIWTSSLIDMRFNYKPKNPLYLVLLRAYRLREPLVLDNTPAFSGCKSWVPIESAISTDGAVPVMDDERHERVRSETLKKL
jgi:hypothetical protein